MLDREVLAAQQLGYLHELHGEHDRNAQHREDRDRQDDQHACGQFTQPLLLCTAQVGTGRGRPVLVRSIRGPVLLPRQLPAASGALPGRFPTRCARAAVVGGQGPEVARGEPVLAPGLDRAADERQPVGDLRAEARGVRDGDVVEAAQVGDRTHVTELEDHRPRRMDCEGHAEFQKDVGARLEAGALLGPRLPSLVQVGVETDDVVRRQQDDDRPGQRQRPADRLSQGRGGLPGQGHQFLPLQGLSPSARRKVKTALRADSSRP